MMPSSITNVSTAREIVRKDYEEFFVKSVVSHSGDPENPDLLGKLTLEVTFTNDPGKTLTLSYADVKYFDVVKAYLVEHKIPPWPTGKAMPPLAPLGFAPENNPNSCKVMILLPDFFYVLMYTWLARTSLQNARSGLGI